MAEAMAEPVKSQSVDFANHGEFFQIRGQLYTLVTLRVVEPEDHQFFMELHKEIGRSPDFYKNAPVVIDVGPIAERKPTMFLCRHLAAHCGSTGLLFLIITGLFFLAS